MQSDLGTLDRLLDTALDLPVEAREQWIESLPPEHAALKVRLRALLARAAQVETSDFLNTLPKFDVGAEADTEAGQRGAEAAGDQIGPYRLIREIGAGGMGAVWLAERHDGALKRPVALKFLHAHGPREALAERLARERDILAGLVHPAIARLYDAGISSEGLPYLALEYVAGEFIDKYCKEHGLGVRARLELFLQVARAVAYAHGKLVVHRDLKPANVLVSVDGQAHLLDFGIAKLLEDGRALETRLTQVAGRALTPEYASPEQILGQPITIASDVYSLGVILYELLADSRPYQLKRSSRGALEEAILESEPKRPSERVESVALRRALRGDLDAIVLKALKKKAEERYPTVNAFAEDIERHLSARPVLAQPDSTAYRLAKFVRRNRLPVATTSLVLLAVVVAAGVSFWQKLEADRQRDAAVLSQRRAEAFSEFMNTLLRDAGPGRPLTATELLDRGTQILEHQQDMDESVAAHMRYELSRNYVLFNQTERELALLERSAKGARRIGDLGLLAAAECSAAWSLTRRDRALAEAKFAEAERVLATVRNPPLFAIADCLRARARLLHVSGDIPEAIAALERGLATLDGDGVQSASRRDLLMTQLMDLYRAADRYKEALPLSEQALNSLRRSGRAGSLVEVVLLNNFANNLSSVGEIAHAAELQRQALEWVERNVPPNMQPVGLRYNLGFMLLRLGEPQRALELADADLAIAQRAGNTDGTALGDFVASRALLQLGRLDEARERFRAAEAVWNSDPKMYARMLTEAALHRAEIFLAEHQIEQARRSVDATLAQLGYPKLKSAPAIDRVLRLAAKIHLRSGDAAAAEALATDALEASRKIARDERRSAYVGAAALLRAQALAEQGQLARAAQDAALATEALRNGFGPEHADTLAADSLLARLKSGMASR